MASNFPTSFDNDTQIPRVDNNITEIGGDAINGLRDAVFAMERTLGLEVHGSATDLVTRLNTALDANGNLKASVLATLWAGSPITNNDIGNNAGIEEIKLDLDYGTAQLKTWIDTLRVRVNTLFQQVAQDISNLAQHTGHPSSYGRHWTSDIDGYTAPYDGYNAQGILSDIFQRLSGHIAHGIGSTGIGAHSAASISADDTNFLGATGDDVQEVLASLDRLEMTELTRHRDRQHSNGILNTQETFYNNTQYGITVVGSAAIETQVAGTRFIRYTASPAGFGNIQRDDTIIITNGAISTSPSYVFKVDRIDTVGLFDFVYIQGSVPADLVAAATVAVYRNTEEASSPSVLANAIKDRTLGAPKVVTLVHPGAPYVVGSGLNPGLIVNGSVENIRIDWSTGTYTFDLEARLTAISTAVDWTPQIIVDTINTEFVDQNLPLVAFLYESEIGIALDEPLQDGYIGIAAPASNSAWAALGFSEGLTWYTHTERKSYVDGYEGTGMALLINETATLAAGGATITFTATTPLSLGVTIGSLIRVENGTDDGTYLVSSIINNTITVINAAGFVGNSATIRVYADTFYDAPATSRTFYETYVDVSKINNNLYFKGIPRVQYTDNVVVGQTLADKVSIIAVSRNFTKNTVRVVYDVSEDTLQLGEPVGVLVGLSPGTEGPTVDVPASPIGKIFRLYDNSRTAYIEVQVIAPLGVGDGILDCDVEDRISEEFHLQTGTVLYNLTTFTSLTDSRLFGTIGRADVRTDFIRDYTSYPLSRIRGNGIIYGFNVAPQGSTSIDAYGGEILVDGSVKNVGTKTINIPNVAGVVTYNLFVDNNGEFNFLIDNREFNYTPSLAEIIISEDKTMIAQVAVTAGSIDAITDYRRFVNNLDNKVELIVEDNDITHGSFATIGSAVNYLNAISTNYPISRTIRIRGDITYDVSDLGATTLPDGITLVGDMDGYNSTYGSRINVTNNTTGSSVLIPQDNCTIKNIAFEAAASSTDMSAGFIGGSTIDVGNLRVEGCSFTYPTPSTTDFYGIGIDQFFGLFISDCRFINCGTAIINVSSGAVAEIRNCYFDNCLEFGIQLNYVINVNIHHNQMRFNTLAASTDGIVINSAFRVNINDNIISSISSDAASANRVMILIDNASILSSVNNNTLVNTSTSNQGFGLGISYGGSGSGIIDHYYANISGNKLENFYGGVFQKPITMLKATTSNIKNNITIQCRGGIDIADAVDWCTYMIISGNNLENVGTGLATLRIRNASSGPFIIDGNIFANIEAVPTMDNISIIGNENLTFSNNHCSFSSATTFTNIDCAMDYANITGNIFMGNNYTNAAAPPLELSGDSGFITGNTFNSGTVAAAAGAILISGAACTEELNKGAYYRTVLGISNANFSTDNTHGVTHSWNKIPAVASIDYLQATHGTYNALFATASFLFDESVVPIGAVINSVDILYSITNAGVAGCLRTRWSKTEPFVVNTSSAVVAEADVGSAGVNQVHTLTPGVTEYMNRGEAHQIYFLLQNDSATWTVNVYAIRINYTL